jgi:hypothetical protein
VAGVVITVTISHGGSLADDLDQIMDDFGMELVVVNGPGACGPCRANKNPHNVPCWECNGNIARIDPDDAKGNLCQCRVEWRRKDDRDALSDG